MTKNTISEKILNIDFLRIVGCLSIVLLHLMRAFASIDVDLYKKLHLMTCNGNKAVDLFFILSGLFFFLLYKKDVSMMDFLKKKLARLYPALIFVLVLWFVCGGIFHLCNFNYYSCLMTFFGLTGTPLTINFGLVSQFWYVSSMLWTMLLLKYLYDNFDVKILNLFLAIMIFVGYGVILHINTIGAIGAGDVYYTGILRALAGMGIGYFIAMWYKNEYDNIKQYQSNIFQKIAITALEFVCLFFIINNLMLHHFKYGNQIIFVVVFTIIVPLFLFKQGYISKLLDNKICSIIARYTYSIFVTHNLIRVIYQNTILVKYQNLFLLHPVINLVVAILLVILLGMITYHLVEYPFMKFYNKKYLKS